MPKKKSKYEEMPSKPCPNCNELVMEDAKTCDFCGYRFEPEDEPASDETALMDELFNSLSEPTVEEEVPVVEEAELPAEEVAFEEEPTPADVEEDALICPRCGYPVEEDMAHCPDCGHTLKEEEITLTSPLQSLDTELVLVARECVDFAKAVPGERTIVRPTANNTYEAIMAPFEIPVEIVQVDEKEAEMLKADHTLRTNENLKIKEIVEAGWVLNNSPEYLQKYFGSEDIDQIYGDGLSNYAEVKGTKTSLLTSGLSVSSLQILTELKPDEQEALAEILADYGVSDMTRISAKRIVDGDRSVVEMKRVIVEESLIRNVVNEMISE